MKKIKTNFNLVRMINVNIGNYIFFANLQKAEISKVKRIFTLLFFILCNSFLFAQAPNISYSGVQSTYTINNAISPLIPANSAGAVIDRTNVFTIAGNGTSGFADGTIASPKFYTPTGIAISTSGNMYIADSQNHCVRKITASGFVSTLAGTGVAGTLNGNADVAQFNTPYSLAVDASENVYVTETNSNAIRKITPAGVVSTFAGNATTSGFLDGQGTTALFASPKGLDADASGNIYVADAVNNRIRKITAAGVVTTFAGDGTAAYLDGQGMSSKFNNPTGVAVTSSGTLYVSDTSNNRIRVISTSGTVTTLAGNGSPAMVNGQGTAAQFNAPRAIAVDASGNIYVVDYSNNRVRKITSSGLVSTLSGTGAFGAVNGAGSVSTFKYPEGIAADASGNIFVADVTNNCIRKITSTGDTSTYAGSATRGLENGQTGTMAMFNSPVSVAVTSGGITYVIDDFNSCIRKVTTNGVVSTFVGNPTTGYADGQGASVYFNNPKGMAIDAAGNIYVADTFNNRIRKVTPAGVVTTIAGDGTAGYLDGQGTGAKFNNPYSLTIDAAGNIYVADTKNNRIRKISTSGAVTTVAGYLLAGYLDGASNVARFKNPQGIVFDNATGIIYVADTMNNRIRKIATDGTVSTFAGSYAGYGDDQGNAAYFNSPIGITISSGNLYIGDYYNSVIRKIDNTGLVSTYAGNNSSDFADGIGNVASFYFPIGVTADASGDVYVADSNTQRVRKITSVDPYAITPALPTGMSFDTSTGIISGTPTEIRATTTYTISASNYSGTDTATISFATSNSAGAPSAPTASAQSFCNSATVFNLVATGTALKWYSVSTGGTALASTTALSTGTYYVSQTVSSVESSRTAVAVTINNTSAPTASAQSFCNSASVANLTASGTSLKWYNVSTGGTALSSTAALVTGTYYVSQTLNSCESSRTSVAVTINSTVAPTASAQTFSNSATVANLVASGTNLQWYNSSSGGTALASTTALSTGTYYVSQTLNSCESSRTAVSVTINTAPGAPTASAQTFCNSATVSNLVATGTSLKWYNVSTGGTALASTTALTTGNYYVSQTVNSIESSRTTVSVTINITSAPTASTQSFCNSASVDALDATGTSLKWYSVATGGTALTTTVSLITGIYYVSQTLNSCESSRTAVAVTINNTSAPTASAQSFCNSASVANLTASGTSLKWYNVSTGGTALSSTAALVTGTYYVSQTLNSCESSRTSVVVTINSTVAPTASSQTFSNSATVANLAATGTNLQWYTSASGGTTLSSTASLSTGTYYVSQTLNSCESSRTAVSVTINTAPGAPTASAQTFCNSATVSNLVATGTSLKWYNVSTGGTALASTTVLTTGNYYVSQTVNSIESSRTTVSVTINITSAPTASAQAFCNSASVDDLDANGTSLKWYNVATGGTALSTTASLSTGTYYVSQTLNSCESSRTAVSVTINNTSAPTASAQSFCNSASVANLTASGTSLKWYNVSAGGTALSSTAALVTGTYYVSQTLNSCESSRTSVVVTINSTVVPTASSQTFSNSATVANLIATGTNLQWYTSSTGGTALASTTALSTGTYYVSQTLNSCESSRTAVSVTINTAPGAPTASAQTFCNSATVANLIATGTSLKWYNVATGGTVLASTTALTSGNYYVSQTLNSIESSRTTVSVTINITAAPTASAQSFCNSASIDDLDATGTSLKWYNVSTGGTALATTVSLTTGTYYVSQTLNSCESSRVAVSVTINNISAPTASAQAFDDTYAATVADLVASGTALQWYSISTGGTALSSTALLVSGNYYVSQTLNSCESSRTLVVVTINITPTGPVAPTASAQTFCNGATVANLVATGADLQWYTVATGGTELALTTALTTRNYYVSQTVNSVESPRTAVAVTVNSTPMPSASSQTFCNGATVANLVATGTSIRWYTGGTGGTPLASTTPLSNGIYYVSQTLNSCESSRIIIGVSLNITATPTASAQTFNNSATVANLVATGTALQWYDVATGGTALSLSTALASGNYYVSQTINSCESARTIVSVTINTATPAPTASAQTFCNGATVGNLTATGTSLQWYSTATGGTALLSVSVLVTGNYYVSQTINSVESSRTIVNVTINTTPAPTASAQAFCNSATVANLVANGTNLKWYTLPTGGTAIVLTAGLVTGNFYVSQTLNSCESTRTVVAVTVISVTAPTASAQTFCSGDTVADLAANGSSLKWYSSSIGGSELASGTVLSTGTYYVSQTVNTCESSRTAVSVTVNTTIAPTASAQTFNNSATVANLVATGTALQWYSSSTGGTALASSTVLTSGNYYVSQTLNSCESSRTLVVVTVNTLVGSAPIASPQTFCSGATVANLVAVGTALKWYNVATGGTALVSTTTLVNGTYYVSQTVNSVESARTSVAITINTTPAPTVGSQSFCNGATIANLVAVGTAIRWYTVGTGGTALVSTTPLVSGIYYVSQTLNSCESSRMIIGVTITTSTSAPTASAQTFCNGATVASLTATGSSLKWYSASTGGTALASTAVLATGTYYVSQTVSSCESSRTAVSITVNTTAAPTGSAQTFNSGVTVANLVATGTSLKWYNVATGGSALATTTTLATGTYYVSQTLNSCESSRTSVAVTVNAGLSAPTAYAQEFCTSAIVANLVATGTALKWYTAATGGSALASGIALTTRNYYVSQTVNSVESSRTLVSVTIYTAPTAKQISTQTYSGSRNSPICNSDTKVFTIASGYSATTIQWERAVVGLNSNNAPSSSAYVAIDGANSQSYTVSDVSSGRYYFRAKFTNGDCDETAVYSNVLNVFYRECGSAKLSAVTYPNPFTDNFRLSLSTSSDEKIMVSIFDLTGRLMEQRESNLEDVSELDLGDRYPSGVYIVNVNQGDNIKTLKVIKR